MAEATRVRKLKWLCRRGMKELDVLLEAFVKSQHSALADGQWPELESLLDNEDDVLWDWLQNPQSDAASHFGDLLKLIRDDSG